MTSEEIEHVEVVDPAPRGMVVIVQGRELAFEPTLEWLLAALAGTDAANQLQHAALVLLTDAHGSAVRVMKNEAEPDELLTLHRAGIG